MCRGLEQMRCFQNYWYETNFDDNPDFSLKLFSKKIMSLKTLLFLFLISKTPFPFLSFAQTLTYLGFTQLSPAMIKVLLTGILGPFRRQMSFLFSVFSTQSSSWLPPSLPREGNWVTKDTPANWKELGIAGHKAKNLNSTEEWDQSSC